MKRAGTYGFAAAVALAAALLSVAAFNKAPPLIAAESTARDAVMAVFRAREAPRDDIVLVLIDETTLTRFPYRSPIDRGFLADLIDGLAALRPRAIGVDLLLDQATEPAKDDILLTRLAARRGPPIVMAVADAGDGLTSPQEAWLRDATAGLRVGHAAIATDAATNVAKAIPGPREMLGRSTASLSASLAAAAGKAAPGEGFAVDFAPVGAGEEFVKRYAAGFYEYLTEAQIADRFVLIGVSLADTDVHHTPLNVFDASAPVAGVEIHAQALAQILDARRLHVTGFSVEIATTLIAALAAAMAWSAPLTVVARAALGVAVFLGAAAAPAAAMAYGSISAPALAPLFASAASGAVVAFARWRAAQMARKRLREGFSRYVAPEVVRKIEAQPGGLTLSGERREITCVFTDVAGFTGLCEGMSPDSLCALLNDYLGGASEIFVKGGGTIDKFVGDAIVGFFGAPIASDDHAAEAIRIAVELDSFAENFRAAARAEGQDFGVTRIGVRALDRLAYGRHSIINATAAV